MKRTLMIQIVGSVVLMCAGFLTGRLFQHNRSGYHFEIRDAKDYDFIHGPIRWRYVTESIGAPLLDPGTTLLEFEGRTIYKAKRMFQESSPYSMDLRTSNEQVSWNDGEFEFKLTIDKQGR
ncbi:MAG TPA: hypothetical protein PLA50_11225 [Bacteroidia bacterium]|nr:hypothetical protein [Bacteroidia bacterium]